MKIKLKKRDVIFSKLIRERANYICEACGVNKRGSPGTLDCAHIVGRRSAALRWHPQGAISLCRSCHLFYTEHPFDWRDWCVDHFGADRVAELRLIANRPVKWTSAVREDIYKHYQKELKTMETERAKGSGLMIDFEPHKIMHIFSQS